MTKVGSPLAISNVATRPQRESLLGPLAGRDYRFLLSGGIVLSIGMWIYLTSMGWVALNLTGSAFRVSLTSAAWFTPFFLFALVAGTLADRLNRKKILLTVRSMAVVLGLSLALLAFTDRLTYPWLVAITFLTGTTVIFELPARQAFTASLLDPRYLINAMALTSSEGSFGRLFGPLVAGFVLSHGGPTGSFAAFALANAVFVCCLLAMHATGASTRAKGGPNPLREMAEGMRYLRDHKDPRAIVLLMILTGSMGWVYVALLPVVTTTVLHGDAFTLGLLSTAIGLGALPATMFFAFYKDFQRPGRALIFALLLWGTAIIAYPFSYSTPLTAAILAVAGFGFSAQITLGTGTLLRVVEPAFHGRVIGTMNLSWGVSVVGTLTAGSVADALGVATAVSISGLLLLVATGSIVAYHPRLLKL